MSITLPALNLPEFEWKIRTEAGRHEIYDPNRKKYIALTPEEWVRQNFIKYLTQHRQYPAGFIKIETKVTLQKVWKRCDAVIYDKRLKPLVIVECKAPDVKIGQDTFNQVGTYNSALKVKYLMVTNGINHYCCEIDFESREVKFLEEIPSYTDMLK